jgi:lambda family phage minor tail protein L
MATTPLPKLVQQAALDERIELFEIDATALGGPVTRFAPDAYSATTITWNGNTYAPVPVESSGWQTTGTGTSPTPRLKVGNVGLSFSALCIAYNDLCGAIVTRRRTFRRYLDGQADADPTMEFDPDIFRINQKTSQNKIFVEWELATVADQEGRLLPGRPILQSACPFRYRVWTGSVFDYTHAACPYTGTNYFDVNGNSVATPALDVPGKRVSNCCRKRFPSGALPFGGFPGAGRL